MRLQPEMVSQNLMVSRLRWETILFCKFWRNPLVRLIGLLARTIGCIIFAAIRRFRSKGRRATLMSVV
jgi:hypothetical protein